MSWTERDAERHLLSLELFGMRFGLDRVRRLLTTLGSPQDRFPAIHVVGSNGKSSTVRMTAAILRSHGLRVGAYLSPHLVSFTERVRVDDADIDGEAFAEAVRVAVAAAAKVDRTLAPGDRCTQFEVLTAAALHELARREVDVAVVEAGLGGRWDATNVLHAEVCVLTSVSLEHTRWLGSTIRDIAREKLAVVPPGGTLVVGADLDPDALDEARRLDTRLVEAPAADAGVELLARGAFQRRNFALAAAAARAHLGALDADAVIAAAAATLVPGRFEQVADGPPTFLDGAHNPSGVVALAETIRAEAGDRPVTAVVSILDDKDAGDMLRTLIGVADRLVLTANANPRALSPATLESLARQLGATDTRVQADPRRALDDARAAAPEDGIVLATGSIYLVSDLLRPASGARSSRL